MNIPETSQILCPLESTQHFLKRDL